ncbi:MAG: sulfotransferase domain-containing protein [Spirochaetota bacterium]
MESWLDAPIKLLTLKYEDMQAEPVAQLGEAARFLGVDVESDVVKAAVSSVSFERLRVAEEANGFIERPPGMTRFFRQGIIGCWQDSLTPAQAERIEADHGPVMRKLGYL